MYIASNDIRCEPIVVFGMNIKRAREQKNMSIIQLSNLSGYDRLCLSRLEYGEQNVRYKTAVTLAKTLDMSFPDLFSRNYIDAFESSQNNNGRYTEKDFLLIFRLNVRHELQSRNVSQNRIYIDCGLAEALVSRIMNGKTLNPTIQTLYKLSIPTNMSLSRLFSQT